MSSTTSERLIDDPLPPIPRPKFKLNPCICFPLQKGVKIIAMINVAFSVMYLTLILGAIMFFVCLFDDVKARVMALDTESTGYFYLVHGVAVLAICCMLGLMTVCIASVFFNLAFLFQGAEEKNHLKMDVWILTTLCFVFLLCVFDTCMSLMADKTLTLLTLEFLQLMYLAYALWVVYEFREEVKPRPIRIQMPDPAAHLAALGEQLYDTAGEIYQI